jgi:hypothetical protein
MTGDIFYLQIILLELPKVSWDDAKTFNGTSYNSFQQAAVAAGLVTEVTAALECFNIFKEVIYIFLAIIAFDLFLNLLCHLRFQRAHSCEAYLHP